MSISSSGAITTTGVISGSNAASASYALNAGLLNNKNSAEFTSTGSFNSYTSSNDATVTSVAMSTALALASIATLTSKTGSYTTTSSFNSYTSSNDANVNCVSSTATSALVGVGALASQTGSYSTTGSNTFVGGQYLSSSFNPTGFSTTASLYTDGGLRVTKDAYISGTLYLNNVTVFGTQSVAYISSSQLNIGTNLITVNTDTPSVRFGGLAVYDSGSTGLTGSILWDSQNNHWVYSNPSGSSYSGGMFISGPRTSTLGSETGTTSCMLLAGQGGDHLTSSMIYHSSTATCFYGNSFISSSGAACFASSVCANSFYGATSIIAEGTLWSGGSIRKLNNNQCLFFRNAGGDVEMTIGGTGNLGIGTSCPGNRLAILAADETTNPTLGTNAGKFGIFNGTGAGTYGIIMGVINNGNVYQQVQRIDGTATAYNLLLQPSGGNVGIGIATANPSAKLTVAGAGVEIHVNNGDTNTLTLGNFSGGRHFIKSINLGVALTPLTLQASSFTFDTGGVGIGNTSPSYQLDMCSGTTVNQRIRLQRGSDDTNQNMLLGWNNIVVTRNNVSISGNQTDFSIIQCGSDGARVPFAIGVGGQACFACNVIANGDFNIRNTSFSTTGTLNKVTWTNLYPSTYNVADIGVQLDGNYYNGAIVFRTADADNANVLVERMRMESRGATCFRNTVYSPAFCQPAGFTVYSFPVDYGASFTDLSSGAYLSIGGTEPGTINSYCAYAHGGISPRAVAANTEGMSWTCLRFVLRALSAAGDTVGTPTFLQTAGFFYTGGFYGIGSCVNISGIMDGSRGYSTVVLPWIPFSSFTGAGDVTGFGIRNVGPTTTRIGSVFIQYK
jgi:hypothetical protein